MLEGERMREKEKKVLILILMMKKWELEKRSQEGNCNLNWNGRKAREKRMKRRKFSTLKRRRFSTLKRRAKKEIMKEFLEKNFFQCLLSFLSEWTYHWFWLLFFPSYSLFYFLHYLIFVFQFRQSDTVLKHSWILTTILWFYENYIGNE